MTQREMAEAVGVFMDRKWCGHPTCDGTCLPDYADSLDAMREVEGEIHRRGLFERYVDELMKVQGWITEWAHVWEHHDAWRGLVLATAAQRLEAAYRTIQEGKGA